MEFMQKPAKTTAAAAKPSKSSQCTFASTTLFPCGNAGFEAALQTASAPALRQHEARNELRGVGLGTVGKNKNGGQQKN